MTGHLSRIAGLTQPTITDAPPLGEPPATSVTVLTLQRGLCHWPEGDPKHPNFHFCGRAAKGHYCEHHARRVYQAPDPDHRADSGHTDDEDGFRTHVAELAAHRQERAVLNRREAPGGAATPWGVAQSATVYADGVVFHATASHGGFKIDETANAKVPLAYRNADGWYEEDCEWANVAAAFPQLFTAYERRCASRTLRGGDTRAKDARLFAEIHAADWIVISAIHSENRPGYVECEATLGGSWSNDREKRRFVVMRDEYRCGTHGFVIDPARHEAYDGPSSFIGWRQKPRSAQP